MFLKVKSVFFLAFIFYVLSEKKMTLNPLISTSQSRYIGHDFKTIDYMWNGRTFYILI